MKFKIFRRKNKVFMTWKFNTDEVKALLPIISGVNVKEVEYRHMITFENEEDAKTLMDIKDILKAIPSAMMLSPQDQLMNQLLRIGKTAVDLSRVRREEDSP